MDIWEFLEKEAGSDQQWRNDLADLFHWSTNYDAGANPWCLFLDLIGWSEDEYGENLVTVSPTAFLGCMEIDKLADALKAYADRPTDVRNWCSEAVNREFRNDEDDV